MNESDSQQGTVDTGRHRHPGFMALKSLHTVPCFPFTRREKANEKELEKHLMKDRYSLLDYFDDLLVKTKICQQA